VIERYSEAQIRFGDGDWFKVTSVDDETGCIEGELRIPVAPVAAGYTMTLKCKRKVAQKLEAFLLAQFDPRYRMLLHVRRNCGPGGHKNSKASRRLLRAAWGCA